MKNFDVVWLEIMAKLRPGDVIKSWGDARGYTGGTSRLIVSDALRPFYRVLGKSADLAET